MPKLGFVFSILALTVQFLICHVDSRAALWDDLYRQYVYPYVFIVIPAFISFFDDRTKYQVANRILLAIGFTLNVVIVLQFFGRRPYRGPSILESFMFALLVLPVVWYFSRCLDRVFQPVWSRVRRFPAAISFKCTNCQYDLRGTVGVSATCPECGEPCPALLDE